MPHDNTHYVLYNSDSPCDNQELRQKLYRIYNIRVMYLYCGLCMLDTDYQKLTWKIKLMIKNTIDDFDRAKRSLLA